MEQINSGKAPAKSGLFWQNRFNKKGTVLAVRAWQPATFFEVDLHLPETSMHNWTEPQHIKCQVAPFTFRDYTPAWWDAGTSTCTLFIDAAHKGAGSRWVKTLQPEGIIHYAGTGPSHQQHVKNANHILLGDQTAIGHFNALQQLAGKPAITTGAVVIKDAHHRKEFDEYCGKLNLQTLPENKTAVDSISKWLTGFKNGADAVFYLAGNSQLVVQLHKMLRQKGFENRQVNAQGFWH